MDTLADARLKDKRIGVVAGTPPATYLVADGLMAKAKPYPLVIDTRFNSSAEAMMNDLASGEIDAGVLWGPMRVTTLRKLIRPMHVTLLMKETGGPRMVYRITMGVRSSDQNWKRQLNKLIVENQPAINKIYSTSTSPFWTATIGSLPAIHQCRSDDAPFFCDVFCRARRHERGGRDLPPEPSGNRMGDYRGPTPATLAGARVV